MSIKKQLETIFYFLNNTRGKIEEYEVKYLLILAKNEDKNVKEEDIEFLNDLIESGDNKNNIDLFINYIME